MCGICDSWFCILSWSSLHNGHWSGAERETELLTKLHREHNRIFSQSRISRTALVFRVLRHHFLAAAARWELPPAPGWNVTESHLSRDFLMPTTDSEVLMLLCGKRISLAESPPYPYSLPSAKGGPDERSGSFLTCTGVERHRYEATGGCVIIPATTITTSRESSSKRRWEGR